MQDATRLLLLLTLCGISIHKRALTINLTAEEPSRELQQSFKDSDHENKYTIQVDDMEMIDKNSLFFILESEDPNVVLSILGESTELKKAKHIIDITSQSGNIMFVLDNKYYNGHLNFFKETKQLTFQVRELSEEKQNYKIKVMIKKKAELDAGKSYSVRIDANMTSVRTQFTYQKQDNYEKIRFQAQILKAEEKFQMSATVADPTGSVFQLNQVFKKTVGGLIHNDVFPICKNDVCNYEMSITVKSVKTFIIECEVSAAIETISYIHYGPYYERQFKTQQQTTYFLPYNKVIKGLDTTITLTPVTGKTGLYIHSQSLPQSLEKYQWQEVGNLAKRITIRSEELKQMQAENSDLYITVYTEEPGEFLINIVAHEGNLKGILDHGVIEGGFIESEEISNYIYMFEIFKSQEISFSVTMNIMTGHANLHLKQCQSLSDCELTSQNMKSGEVFSLENEQEKKVLKHTFKCEHNKKFPSTICYFVIGVIGKENNGTHYDISLHEDNKHRLITPGHLLKSHLGPTEIEYFKFSYPKKKSDDSKLILSVEAVWGNFSIYLSKNDELPTANQNQISRTFQSSKSGLYSSLQEIVLNDEMTSYDGLEGVFYVGIESLTSCQVNLKFYELDQNTFTFHVLRSGEQQRGTIHKGQDMVYFNIKASLTQEQASTVTVNLTPIRGTFEIFTAREGKFPNKSVYDLSSKNNILELTYDEYKNKEEYIIGVAPLNQNDIADDLQFVISFNYSNKPIKLKPGILSNFYIKNQNYFIIEITKEMAELLVLQSYRDSSQGYCAFFNGLENFANITNQCQFDSKNSITMFFKQDQIKEQCDKFPENSCFLILKIEGSIDHKFSIGYTYNDKPFKLVKQTVVQGPWITQGKHKINFIQHLDQSSDEILYFNSKGLEMNIYAKLIDGDKIKDELIVPFPNNINHDAPQKVQNGNVTTIFYPKKTISEYGKNPELLISIRPNPTANFSEVIFDGNYQFSMHSGKDSIPLTKNQPVTFDAQSEELQFFNFYNHGEHDFFTYSITSNSNAFINSYLAKDLNSKPPFTPFLLKKSGFGSVILLVKKENLQGSQPIGNESMRGYFTIGVRCKDNVSLSIFWNNTPQNDIFELTPGHPTTILSSEYREQYFSFMARDQDQLLSSGDRGKVRIYINSEVKCNIYLSTSQNMSEIKLDKMNEDYIWKSSIGVEGGVHLIEIKADDSSYCVNCLYYGYIETLQGGQIQILASIEHLNQPINLMNGLTYPEVLRKDEKKVYQYFNGDVDQFSLSFSVLTGYIKIFIHTTADVGSRLHTEEFRFGNEQKYGYVIVKPSKYKVNKEQNFYFSIEQDGDQKAAFNLSVIKSNLKMQINVGVTKQIGVAIMESAEFFFQNKQSSKTYNLDIEIVKMDDIKLYQQAQLHLSEFIEVYQDIKKTGKVNIPLTYQAHDQGRLRVTFDLVNSPEFNYYTIQLYNKIDTFIQFNVILTENHFKLLHLDENSVELIKKSKPRIFEVTGQNKDFLYFNLQQCIGNTNISFYEGDYDDIQNNKQTDAKKLIEKNSFIHYIKPTYERIFIKVEIPDDSVQTEALININAFSEKHLDKNPYTELYFKNYDTGNLQIDTEHSQITFDPIRIKSTYSQGFKHKVDYIVFMTESIDARNFLKSCQNFYFEKFYPDQKYIEYVYQIEYNSIEELNKNAIDKITIKLEGLIANKKYYGVVLAKVSLFVPDEKQLKPVKFGVNYYDEFILLSPRYSFPFIYAISVIFVLGVLFVIYNVINDYVFGKIGDYEIMSKLSEFRVLDNNVFGFNTEDILEDEYYSLKQKEMEGQVSVERVEEDKNEQQMELEMTDRNVPLEMNL